MLPFIDKDKAATKLSCLHNVSHIVYGINDQGPILQNPLFEETAHTECCGISQGHMLLTIKRKAAYDGTNKYTKYPVLRLATPMGLHLHNWLEDYVGYFSGADYYDTDWWTKNGAGHGQTGNGIAVVKIGSEWLSQMTSGLLDPVLPLPNGVLITESGVHCDVERSYDFSGAHSLSIAFVMELPTSGLAPNAYYQSVAKASKMMEKLAGGKLLKQIDVSVECVNNAYDRDELFAELMALT